MRIFYKVVDKSVLKEGFSIPVVYKELLFKEIGFQLLHGERREIQILIDDDLYEATMTNINFDQDKYSNHKDILQIRYKTNGKLAQKLREKFGYTADSLIANNPHYSPKWLSSLPENKKEFITIYSTPVAGTIMFECISNQEFCEETSELVALGEKIAESILDETDPNAGIKLVTKTCKVRRLTKEIVTDLKEHYRYRCQICGQYIGEKYGSKLIHAHHIIPFVTSMNNDMGNIMILCPNHHGIIHDQNPIYDKNHRTFKYPNGYVEELLLNDHL